MSSFYNKTYDNTDTVDLDYQGGWFLDGNWNATAYGQTGTLASTYDTSCNVTFIFPVPAVAFYYWGFKNSRGAQWGICIDCNPNNRTFIQIDGEDPTYNGDGLPLLLYWQTFQEPGIHEIILRNEPDPRFNGTSRITLARFDIEVPVDNNGSTTIIITTVPPSSSPTASSTSTAYSSPSQKEETPLGAILGGALGGLILIFFSLYLFFCRRRQKFSSAESPFSVHRFVGNSTQVNSHLFPSVNHISEGNRTQDTTSNPPLAAIPPSPFLVHVGNSTQENSHLFPSVNHISKGNRTQDTTSNPPLAVISPSVTFGPPTPSLHNQLLSPRRPIREIDAGPANMTDDNQPDDTLPPEYTQVFA